MFWFHFVDHKTAYFEVTTDMPHGSDLVCSYPQCRDGGVKFLYCKFCDTAIARRSFRSQHLHSGEESPSDFAGEPTAKRQKIMSYSTVSAAVVSNDCASSSSTESSDGSGKQVRSDLKQMKQAWEGLLQQRVDHKSEDDVSPWLMTVLQLSDRYASLLKESD